jgi:uncharacterized protein YcbX
MPVTVTALAIAPVKGMRLVAVGELELGSGGAVGDRAFVVVEDADNRLVATARNPDLVQVAPRWDPDRGVLTLVFPGGEEVAGAVGGAGEAVTTALYDGRRVGGRLLERGPLSEAVSDHLGRRVRLMRLDAGMTGADDFPVTLMSTASLAAVTGALGGEETDPRRFRMTVTVDGLDAWAEHGWAGREVRLGPEVVLRVVDPVPRCVVTTSDPDDGAREVPVLHALARLRGKDDVTFGVWCQVVAPGRVRRGDAVSVDG